jgi:MFS family permease
VTEIRVTDSDEQQPALAGRYSATVGVALLALCPNIILTTAFPYLEQPITKALGISQLGAQTAEGLSNAGYACGAVIAAWLVQRFRQRALFLATEAVFVIASLLTAVAWTGAPFVAGRILQGTATGLMLVIALPPLVTGFGARKLPLTATAVNIGLFGAVTVGPLLGGLTATGESWRVLMAAFTALAAAGLALAYVTLPHRPPFDPDVRPDGSAFALAIAATALPFYGVSQLVTTGAGDPLFWAPLAVGVLALVALVVNQYRRSDALMPVRALSTSLPVTGTVTAMVAGAAFVTLLELATTSLLDVGHERPLAAGLLFWPQVLGVVVAAVVFGAVFRTRYVPVLVVAGFAAIVAGAALLLDPSSHAAVLAAAGALGVGAGATVSPGLFLAALGVPSSRIGRAFALVELLRSEAAYLVAPVLLHVAMGRGSLADGLRLATWITLAGTVAGLVLVVALYVASGARLRRPDLETWLAGDEGALESPATAALVRPGS